MTKKKVYVLVCAHETKYGIDNYISLHPSPDRALDYVKIVKKECGYDPQNFGKYFNADYKEQIIDVDLFPNYTEEEC